LENFKRKQPRVSTPGIYLVQSNSSEGARSTSQAMKEEEDWQLGLTKS